jgi:hypothetical protein
MAGFPCITEDGETVQIVNKDYDAGELRFYAEDGAVYEVLNLSGQAHSLKKVQDAPEADEPDAPADPDGD